MKKVAIGLVVFVVVLGIALVVGPGLIDWNSHTDRIAAQIEKLTGRKVTIAGDVRLQLIPRPQLAVSKVSLSNLPGAADTLMASLDSLEVRVAAVPLLTGNVKVETVKLVRPVVHLERLADGRVNWEFKAVEAAGTAPAKPAAPAGAKPGDGKAGGVPAVAVDSFTIENGTMTLRDAAKGTVERLTGIDARIAAASLEGPIESDGKVTFRGMRLAYSANVAEMIRGRTVPVNLRLGIGEDANVRIGGSIVGLPDAPKLRGKLSGDGKSVAGLIDALAGPGKAPPGLAKAFALEGDVEASAAGGRVDNLRLRLGETDLKVSAAVTTGDVLDLRADVAAGWIDLDAWLASVAPKAENAAGKNAGTSGDKPAAAKKKAPAAAPAGNPLAALFPLPQGVRGSLSVAVDSLVHRRQVVRNASLSVELVDGEITLNQLTAQLPGGTDVGVFGFLSDKNGKPRFEGQVEARADNLRPVLAWLGGGGDLPKGGFEKFAFKTPVIVDGNYAWLTAIDSRLNGSRATGAVTLALAQRPSFGADLTVDKVNLDAYLGTQKAKAAGGAKPGVANKAGDAASGGKTAGAGTTNPLAALKVLDTFDANVKAKVGSAVYQGHRITGLAVDASLLRGVLTLRQLKVANAAGLSASATGVLSDLAATPNAKALRVRVSARDLTAFQRMTGLTLPVPAKQLGRVAMDATVNGPLLSPAVNMNASAAGGDVSVKGQLPVLALAGGDLNLKWSAKHGDLAELLRRLGVAYQPAGKIGGFDLAGDLVGNLKAMRVENLAGRVGGVKTTGNLAVDLNGPLPKLTAALRTGRLTIDPFLPAQRRADLWRLDRRPVVWLNARPENAMLRRAALSSRWSRAPIDLGVLSSFDGAVTFAAPAVVYQGTAFEQADLAATLSAGTLTIDHLKGRVFGGPVEIKGRINAAGRVELDGGFTGIDASRAAAVAGTKGASGRVDGSFNLTTKGRNQAEMVSALNGSLAITGKGLDIKDMSSLGPGAGAAGMLMALNQLGGVLGGPKAGSGFADVDARFTIDRGIATPQSLKVLTNVGVATATGTVDLPAWQVDLKGGIQPAPNLLTAILSAKTKLPKNVPFAVSGALDKPNVKVETAGLAAGGVAIPGVDRLLKKKGVGSVLQGILGGGSTSPQQQPSQDSGGSAPPPPQGSSSGGSSSGSQKITPQDILRGILGR